MSYELKDSGDRREFGTGAVRDMAEGKGRTDLLPFFALLELSKHFEAGAKKYDAENWRKGIDLRTYLDSAIRHLFKFALGMRDERHDLAALWNVACLIETQHMIDRGILPATLGNLPDWYDPHTDDGRVTNADPASADSDFRPVDELNDWLTNLPPVMAITFTDEQQKTLREYARINLSEHEREYTRGHADETAARFNAGLSYADTFDIQLRGPLIVKSADDIGPRDYPRLADVQDAADADVDEGLYAPLPSAGQIADVVESDAALVIGTHPLFAVTIINGDDLKDYVGPEVCSVLPDNCGCGTQYSADEVNAGWVLVRKPDDKDLRRWVVTGGKVYFSPATVSDRGEYREAVVMTPDNIRDGVLRGHFIIEAVGRNE